MGLGNLLARGHFFQWDGAVALTFGLNMRYLGISRSLAAAPGSHRHRCWIL